LPPCSNPFALFDSALRAVHKEASGARFATVSGDLISHSFQCKYSTLFPQAGAADFPAFVEKTIAFVTDELAAALPGVRLYIALGNNDSPCGDYRLDAHSDFLAVVGEQVSKTLPPAERKAAQETFAAGGYMSVPLPMHDTRMLILDNLFMGAKYANCSGKPDPAPAEAQIAWLTQQLAEARNSHRKVWFMAHIPPGVDVHASVLHTDRVCSGSGPTMFLSNEKLADVLASYSDVVELGIFAHTHMDEVRVLKPASLANPASPASLEKGVPVKLVSSISPINGNAPSFTVGRIDENTAALEDFQVFAASNQTGIGATWSEEYDWDKTYHQPAFDAASVGKVIAGFKADSDEKTEASQAYIKDFYVGKSALLALVWPPYVCSLASDSAGGYKACVCPAAKP
jgi:sphingomyelin phosphodiesterase acid-like 3